MKKEELLNYFDDKLLDMLYGFCYARTNDSYEAQDLCSDIILALIRAARTQGEIENIYSYIWRIARNVYADFSEKRKKHADTVYEGDAEAVLTILPMQEQEEDNDRLLGNVYRRIAFLTRAYREVMILFYIDGLSAAQIAQKLNTSEVAVRQRLFSARKKVKSEVEKMGETCNRPVMLDKIELNLWGTGNPMTGDPREVCTRQFSKHILWLCRKKTMSAAEIAEELNVPTVYVEEEMEILTKGTNSKYGLLRRLENGRYAINFILFDRNMMEKAIAVYAKRLPTISSTIMNFIEAHKEEYLAFPYVNKKVDLNLILWQQIFPMATAFGNRVEEILAKEYFSDIPRVDRSFTVFGFEDYGVEYGAGWDGVSADNICGYSRVFFSNIYITRIKPHFHCGMNIGIEPLEQLAIRAVEGLPVETLSELEKEHAAKAIECGYLYREDNMLYTKILVNKIQDESGIFEITRKLQQDEAFEAEAHAVAEQIADLIYRNVPAHLLSEWEFANRLADLPVLDALVEVLIEKGFLTPPEDGIGAEGCWMMVEK